MILMICSRIKLRLFFIPEYNNIWLTILLPFQMNLIFLNICDNHVHEFIPNIVVMTLYGGIFSVIHCSCRSQSVIIR